jgi:hypothetical protein
VAEARDFPRHLTPARPAAAPVARGSAGHGTPTRRRSLRPGHCDRVTATGSLRRRPRSHVELRARRASRASSILRAEHPARRASRAPSSRRLAPRARARRSCFARPLARRCRTFAPSARSAPLPGAPTLKPARRVTSLRPRLRAPRCSRDRAARLRARAASIGSTLCPGDGGNMRTELELDRGGDEAPALRRRGDDGGVEELGAASRRPRRIDRRSERSLMFLTKPSAQRTLQKWGGAKRLGRRGEASSSVKVGAWRQPSNRHALETVRIQWIDDGNESRTATSRARRAFLSGADRLAVPRKAGAP